jgi:hypothetical protein
MDENSEIGTGIMLPNSWREDGDRANRSRTPFFWDSLCKYEICGSHGGEDVDSGLLGCDAV